MATRDGITRMLAERVQEYFARHHKYYGEVFDELDDEEVVEEIIGALARDIRALRCKHEPPPANVS